MKIIPKLFIPILCLFLIFLFAAPAIASDITIITDWISQLQYSDPSYPSHGAIKIHHTPGYIDPNNNVYYLVSPYNSHIAVLGLLDSDAEDKLDVTEKWISWYLDHLNMDGTPEGVVYDHWYLADGSGETTAPEGINPYYIDFDDVSDSYAALFLEVSYKYLEKGGSASFLNAPGNKEKFEIIANVILTLQDPVDGLTWGKSTWPVKYLMDNCEVHKGLKSMEKLERYVFGDRNASRVYKTAAKKVKNGINNELYNTASSLYRYAKFEDGSYAEADLNTWYPGTTHLAWPVLFEVIKARSVTAQMQMNALNDSWDGSPNPDWTGNIVDAGGFTWPSISYTALLAGDTQRAQAHADFIVSTKLPDFAYPFTVDDAGFLLQTLISLQ